MLLNIENNRVNIIEKNNINLFCKKCKNNFIYNSQEIKLFNEFTKDKIDILCIIHTLLKRKFANPKGIKKYCLCELPLNIKYKHIKDNGNLLEGFRQGKKIIICDKCFQIFEYKNYNNWICPECGLKFNEKINSKYNTAISNNKMKSIFLNNKIIEKERENSKINNNNINNQRYRLRDNKKNINLNKISTNESLEQLNKNNNNIKTSIIQLNKENSNTNTNFNDSININININKSKRVISSKLLSQENRIKRNYNNTNSNLVESKYISKKDNNNKNQIKNNKEQNNKNNNVIKVDFGKYNNTNLNSAKSSLNILSKNENKNIQIKNINEKNKNNINMKSSNSNMKIEILKRNYSLDKNKEEKNTNNKNNNNNIINSNRNIKIKYNNEKGDNKLSDKVIQRNKGSPNHKRVDIVETRLKKNLNSKNNIQNINIKFSQDFDNIISNNIKNNLNNSKSNKEIKEFKPLYKSINLINNNSNNQPNNSNNSNNIYISDNSKEKEETSKSIKDTSKENKENVTKEKGIIKIDTSRNISSEGYQFNSDNYNIVQLLGEGTFGKIYLVEDPDDLKKYALKKISVSDLEELNDTKKEFELLMKLSQENPSLNVVKIYGIQIKKLDKFNLVMYVLMEAAQCDWENEIRNRNQYQAYYTEEELMKILLNLSTTLASLQKMGICHRDVKPQNILCFGKDNYKLSDFGEAKKKKKRKINGNYIYDFEGDTSKQTVRGTELYMSPILFKALHDCPEVDLEYNAYKSDVFSLGLCMLLSSTLGFQALYDIRELYDNNKIKKIIEKYLSVRYSKDYIKLISSMLQIKEKNRPDFIELQENIQKIYYHKDKKE